MKVWARDIPNEGIIRYYIAGNLERITVTSPKVLSEVLVSKAYDFAKPLVIQQGLGRLLGNGILLAEGDEHKVGNDRLMSPVLCFDSHGYRYSSNARILCQPLHTVI